MQYIQESCGIKKNNLLYKKNMNIKYKIFNKAKNINILL